MGLYSRHVFPWILDQVMSRPAVVEQRPRVLAQAGGAVLEIGFGTGLNLPHYPAHIGRLTAVEPNPGMRRRADRRMTASTVHVEFIELADGRDLPAPDETFDTVISTWTLCSVGDAAYTLGEIHRVLKPGGRFLFIEHGLSPEPRIAAWQRRLNALSTRLGDGCHLDRNIAGLIAESPLAVEQCDQFYMSGTLRVGGFTYRGVALK